MKGDVLKHVEFLDKVKIYVYRGQPTKEDLCPLRIEFHSLDKAKKVVFDDDALKQMNETLTEKAKQFNANDPRLTTYLEEFSGRFANELYRNGLVEIVDIPNAPDDPYAVVRKSLGH